MAAEMKEGSWLDKGSLFSTSVRAVSQLRLNVAAERR